LSYPIDVSWPTGGNSYSKADLLLILPIQKLSERKVAEKLPSLADFVKGMKDAAAKPAPVAAPSWFGVLTPPPATPAPKKRAVAKPKAPSAPWTPPPAPVKATKPTVGSSMYAPPTLEQFIQAKKTQAAIVAGTLKIREVKPVSKSILQRVKDAANKNVSGQTDMAKQALTLEAARVLNVQLLKVIEPKLPIMVRGYAKTALGKAVIANALNIAMEAALPNLAPNDPRKKIAEAAVVMSYQEFLAGFKAEELLDELFSNPALANLVGKVSAE
jgi:hypothetical protein